MIGNINFVNALMSLRPEAEWTSKGNDITWLDTKQTQPTQEEIDAEVVRLQAEYNAQEYARKRKSEYPSIPDFMEAYTENEIGGDSTKWDAYVINYNKVRTENPK